MVEQIYQLLLAAGYPPRGVDWLRQHRLATITVAAIAAWVFFIALGWLAWVLLTR